MSGFRPDPESGGPPRASSVSIPPRFSSPQGRSPVERLYGECLEQPLTEPRLDMPEFEVVRRGVDRRQVEEWGSKLTRLIEQERRRADQVEQALDRMQLNASWEFMLHDRVPR